MRTSAGTEHDETPTGDRIVLLRDTTWADYQRMLEIRHGRRVPRLAYQEGVLELMSPSREHEILKSCIGRLLEVWCEEQGVEFTPSGSWTLESKAAQRGLEPDESYVFGDPRDAQAPDLAIEVVWTSGGLDKRELYAALGVKEVWFWRRGDLTVHVLRGGEFVEGDRSVLLPRLDLGLLMTFVDRPTVSQAIREYRAALRAQQ
jgi:Uma2 family endonuclease